jgi:hypothetical protein
LNNVVPLELFVSTVSRLAVKYGNSWSCCMWLLLLLLLLIEFVLIDEVFSLFRLAGKRLEFSTALLERLVPSDWL